MTKHFTARMHFIRNHPLYLSSYARLEELEKDRIFCCHQMNHLLDVARIACIFNLERNLGIEKDIIYSAALLHDIGKYRQYEEGIPHEIASTEIAGKILADMPADICFSGNEQQIILTAITGHRKLRANAEVLEALIYESDKASRACFACPAEPKCNWSNTKKNWEIYI